MTINFYPFSAIIGQDAMKTALLLNAVDPTIGGVLIRGQKGTAKSTAVRALAALLPELSAVKGCPYHCSPDQPELMHAGCLERWQTDKTLPATQQATPMVELPLGATEDRVVGSVHLEETLRSGQRQFEPGLLAAANRGILYVDEVNLLEDHLVDLLLDAAASGINRVEREGLCVTHPARFILIGTMNPEEGELRPQFLDRFGLSVSVEGLSDPKSRRELIRNRLAYEENPAAFALQWQAQESFLAAQIVAAQQRLNRIEIPDQAVDLAVMLALKLKVHGHRADIALLKVARALSALLDKTQVGAAEIREAAWFVLPHRVPGGVLMDAGQVEKTLALAINAGKTEQTETVQESEDNDTAEQFDGFEFPGSAAAGTMLFETFKKKLQNGSSI
ncbi:MAG: ATP-binding protein [Deltaproteobacteria bacterium]|nr:ATP-binding protein [Deltaproteobacteria bacterium]